MQIILMRGYCKKKHLHKIKLKEISVTLKKARDFFDPIAKEFIRHTNAVVDLGVDRKGVPLDPAEKRENYARSFIQVLSVDLHSMCDAMNQRRR